MTNQMLNQESPTPAAPTAPSSKLPNKIGLIALIAAGVGFILAVIPATAGMAWILTLAALVLGIIGLTRKGAKKGTSIIAIVLATVAWIVAIMVAISVVAVGVSEAIDKAGDAPAVTEIEEAAAPEGEAPKEAAIGDVVTTKNDVAFTVTGVECGLTTASTGYSDEVPSGQFCAVSFNANNKGKEPLSFSSSSISGFIGDAKYDAEGTLGNFGADSIVFATLNPGLAADGVAYFDVPAPLEVVKFSDSLVFGDEVAVRVL